MVFGSVRETAATKAAAMPNEDNKPKQELKVDEEDDEDGSDDKSDDDEDDVVRDWFCGIYLSLVFL